MKTALFDLPKSKELGASAIVVALCLLLLMGMAALAFDVGLGMNERRQDQSAADVGSLAAAQFAKPIATVACSAYSGIQLARCNGAVEAIAVANATLDDPALANWASSAECVAPPVGYVVAPITPCVAFNNNLQRAWVHVPTIEVGTVFGRVIGWNAINTSADAIAITSFANGNNLLPFLTPGISGTGDYDCLKTSGNPDWKVCEDLPSTGNFGSADYFVYGNELAGSVTQCSGGTNTRLIYNIANGVDHPLSTHTSGSGGGIEERGSCPIFSAEPNMLEEQTGVASNLDDGLTRGGTAHSIVPYDGRIEDPSGFLVRTAQGPNPATLLDNTPLWSYLLPGLSGNCSGVNTPSQMVACLNQAKASGTVIFSEDIADAPRFGFTALMWETTFAPPGTVTYHVQSFLPVYLDSTYYGCNANSCSVVHTVGVADTGACPNEPEQITCGTPGNGNTGLEAVSSYILSPDLLPEGVKTPYPGEINQRSFALAR